MTRQINVIVTPVTEQMACSESLREKISARIPQPDVEQGRLNSVMQPHRTISYPLQLLWEYRNSNMGPFNVRFRTRTASFRGVVPVNAVLTVTTAEPRYPSSHGGYSDPVRVLFYSRKPTPPRRSPDTTATATLVVARTTSQPPSSFDPHTFVMRSTFSCFGYSPSWICL